MSETLASLGRRILSLHQAAEAADKTAKENRVAAGVALIKAKSKIQGSWLEWLETVPIPESTARKYMDEARSIQPMMRKSTRTSSGSVDLNQNQHTKRVPPPLKDWSARHAEIKAVIVDNPHATANEIKEKTGGAGNGTIAKMRAELEKDGLIPVLPEKHKVRGYDPGWQLPHKKLRVTVGIFDSFLEFVGSTYAEPPKEVESALLDPRTPTEETMLWGFLDTIDKIEVVLAHLKEKYRKKAHLRVVS